MDKPHKNFIKFLEQFYCSCSKNEKAEAVRDGVCSENVDLLERRRCILQRLKIINNEEVESVSKIIVNSKTKNYIDMLKKEIEYAMMNYTNDLLKSLPEWSVADFESLHSVLYGQAGE